MKKEHIVRAMTEIIHEQAERYGLTVTDRGTGHAYDNSFWKDILRDVSGIPEINAECNGYSIGLRSFWGSPELCVRREFTDGRRSDLLVLTYSDSAYRKKTADDKFHEYEVKKIMDSGIINDFSVKEASANEYGSFYSLSFKAFGKEYSGEMLFHTPEAEETECRTNMAVVTKYLNRSDEEVNGLKEKIIGSLGIGVLKELIHTGDFTENEIRAESEDPKACIKEIYELTDIIREKILSYEREEKEEDVER